jgi:signal transduction histidine kinase
VRLVQLATAEELPPLRALREGQAVGVRESTLVNAASGDRLTISDSAAPVIDTGQLLGAVMVFRDVTLQKKLQRQLELADRLASLGTLAAGVAHEINNPLAVITGNVHLLSQELKELQTDGRSQRAPGPEADQRERKIAQSIEDLQTAAGRIGRIVSDLGWFSRPAAVAVGQADVVQCVEWAVRTTAHEFRQRARLLTDLGPVVPVRADEGRLEQVIINLLMNAAQAIEPGKSDQNQVSVATHMVPDGRVAIEVRDTGAGIPSEQLSRIFEPFFTTKEVGLGTGLGLAICYGIVHALGGEIEVQSEVGKGTLVRVTLLAATPAAETAKGSPPDGVDVVRARILVVEDEAMVRRVLERVLADHDLRCLERGAEALALIAAGERFDLILCDLMMPTMSGIELYEKLLKTDPELARRVVFITGGATTVEVDDFLRSVPNPRIPKPFEIDALRKTVQRLLRAGGPSRP